MIGWVKTKLTYANVIATLALFIALGGTSYAALKLPRNSVGSAQIRASAVHSRQIHNGSVALADISAKARTSLQGVAGPTGPQGPAGAAAVQYFAAVSAAGAFVRGNATSGGRAGSTGAYVVGFAAPVSSCVYTATLGSTDASTVPAGRATVSDQSGRVGVQTYDAGGAAADLPFHLQVSC